MKPADSFRDILVAVQIDLQGLKTDFLFRTAMQFKEEPVYTKTP
jgi:hypothetical protein